MMLIPNVRVLNLNYNFLEDVRQLEGLTRLKKLTVIGSRLKGTRALIRVLQRMPDVEMLDFRCVCSRYDYCICAGQHGRERTRRPLCSPPRESLGIVLLLNDVLTG